VLPLCPCSLGYYSVCSSSIYEYWLPLWYLQTSLNWYQFLIMIDTAS
jgi:hypothetical protein